MSSRFIQTSENTLSVQGDLDVYSVAEAIKEGCKLIKSNQSVEVIDLSQVGKVDSASLAFVIELMKETKKKNEELHFQNIPAKLHAVANVYGLARLLPEDAFEAA